MPEADIGITQLGIASILKQNQLVVPQNQREYSWTEKETKTLFQDFQRAISDGDNSYFLGTIVTIPRANGTLEVLDGQQRLATTAIFLSAIRDYLRVRDPIIAEAIENDSLTAIDRAGRARIPRLRLNLADNDYFRARLTGVSPAPKATKPSHELIDEAFSDARARIVAIVAGFDEKDHGDVLNRWIDFMEMRALTVLLKVPNDANAYRMFETLNDRGLRATQADLIKNYLLGRSADRVDEVQQKWASMRGALETIEEDDITVTFLRHALIAISGFVRDNKVYDTVQTIANAPQPVVTFTGQLENLASTYVAIQSSEHDKWNSYSELTKRAIEVLNVFDIKPLRPLLLAIAQQFSDREAEQAMRFCVSLSVRLMIGGGTRTGSVEEGLADAAHKVFVREVATATALKEKLRSITPTDVLFVAAFENATVSNPKLARYYLRSMELAVTKDADPWHIPNDDRNLINLEHILPEKTEGHWPTISDDEVKIYYRRMGNLCLMQSKDNSTAKSAAFDVKKPIYATSGYELTRHLGEAPTWNPAAIIDRQKALAQIALKTWPI